jgi:hypothetical protein
MLNGRGSVNPSPLGDWAKILGWRTIRAQATAFGTVSMDNEVSLCGAGGRCRRACEQHGDGDLCRSNQPGPCAHVGDTAAHIGVKGGAVCEREELAPAVIRISGVEEAVSGSALMGSRVLGGEQGQRHGRGVEEVHRGLLTFS